MREHLLGDLPVRGDLYDTGSSKGPGLAGKNDEGETHPLHPSLVHHIDFTPARDVLSFIHGCDHEMPHSN